MKRVEIVIKEIKKSPVYKTGDEFLFKAGIEFCQRFIPVEEEYPEANPKEPCWSKEIICKLKSGYYKVLQFNVENKTFEDANNIYEKGEVTHWRPIYFL